MARVVIYFHLNFKRPPKIIIRHLSVGTFFLFVFILMFPFHSQSLSVNRIFKSKVLSLLYLFPSDFLGPTQYIQCLLISVAADGITIIHQKYVLSLALIKLKDCHIATLVSSADEMQFLKLTL